MVKLHRFSEKLANHAKNNYKKHSFLKEWRVFILLTLVLKVSAMVFSIFAGFFFFENLFVSILNNLVLAKIFSIIALLLIEVLTAISLSKFFKFGIRFDLKKAIPVFLLSCFFFSISFISSTTGLALRQGKKVDNTTAITAKYNDDKRQITTTYQLSKQRVNDRLQIIKKNPQGWINGKRSVLTNDQLTMVKGCYDEFKFLENNYSQALQKAKRVFNADLLENSKYSKAEAEKYYKIVSGIMLLIFMVNGILMFLYSRIFSEKEKEAEAAEIVNDYAEEITDKTTKIIRGNIEKIINTHLAAMTIEPDGRKTIITAPEIEEVEPSGVIGFRPQNKRPTAAVNANTDNCLYCGEEFEKVVWNKKYCCEAHKIKAWEEKHGKKVVKRAKKG